MKNPQNLAIFRLADDDVIAPLPAAVTKARDTHLRVQATEAPTSDLEQVISDQAARVVAGEPLDVAAIQHAYTAQAVAGHAAQALRIARDSAANDFDTALREHADLIVTKSMAPRVKRLAIELKSAFESVAMIGVNPSAEALLQLPTATQRAYLRFGQIADQLAVIASARDEVYRAVRRAPAHDTAGYFATVRNFEQCVPSVLGRSRNHVGREVPDGDTREWTAWFVSRGAEFWCPTIAEQDARWDAVFGERLEQQRRNQHALEGFRAIGGVTTANAPLIPVSDAIGQRLGQAAAQ